MSVFYNEIDEHAAQWLRNLGLAGEIERGLVDSRDIRDIAPFELFEFERCHFFAGVGVWDYALRLAGWPRNRPVWTGSCPCQPFSAAGARGGFADERHLWPHWFHLIEQRRPATVFGEQVASKDGLAWFDLVRSDLEAAGYAVGVFDLCAAGFGAPHIRQRLFFVAHAESVGLLGRQNDGDSGRRQRASGQGGASHELEHAERARLEGHSGDGDDGGEPGRVVAVAHGSTPETGASRRPGPTNGFWRDADWLLCTDGKWRPVEPGSFPLVDGSAFKLGSGGSFEGKTRAAMLRGYGNAIVAPVAAAFVSSAMEALGVEPDFQVPAAGLPDEP